MNLHLRQAEALIGKTFAHRGHLFEITRVIGNWSGFALPPSCSGFIVNAHCDALGPIGHVLIIDFGKAGVVSLDAAAAIRRAS